MDLIIASNNAHKIYEIKKILAGRFDSIRSLREAGIEHETVEDGTTFLENARKKAREICELTGMCALADDSGISADALGGAPGIFSARYAGLLLLYPMIELFETILKTIESNIISQLLYQNQIL